MGRLTEIVSLGEKIMERVKCLGVAVYHSEPCGGQGIEVCSVLLFQNTVHSWQGTQLVTMGDALLTGRVNNSKLHLINVIIMFDILNKNHLFNAK